VADFQPGDVFAGHRIQGVAGRGGMGVVYRATQLDLDRPVALKLIAPSLAEDPEFRDRFVRESRAAASIDHPNVIPIYYTGEHDGLLFIAMRYVEGSDLRTLVRAGGRLEPERAARIVAQVGAALDAAHARGLVHRDVKPANVLLGGEDHAYLTDFGLTKRLTSAGAASTRPGGWVGTLGYVAPEQIRGERVDARADVYALGCVLFHALTGGPPYQRERDEATLWAHLNDPPPSASSVVPGVPDAFEDVLRRAMAKDPADRFPSAGDLGRAALAATGAHTTERPERTVAVGAAAPAGDEETVVSAEQSPTRMATRRQEPASAPARPAGRPRWAWALALVPVLLLAVAGLVVLDGGGDGASTGDDGPGATRDPDDVPSPAGRATARATVGGRPNDIVVAGGSVWVLRGGNERLAVLDARTGERRSDRPLIGGLPASAAAGFGRLWVARQVDPALVAIGLRSRRRSGAEVPLGEGGDRVVAVAAGENAVFVGLRTRPGRVLRIDPRRRAITKTITLEQGVQDMAVGEGAIWVTGRRDDVVTRVDIRTAEQQEFRVGRDPSAVAVGEDGIWVANRGDDTLTRLDAGSFNRETLAVGRQPAGVGVGGNAVWVANRLGNTVTRLDPRTGGRVGRSVVVPGNPYAIDVRGREVWVTSLGRGTVTRIEAS
jgi:hypothetical protein